MTVYSVDSGQVASCASRIQVTCDSIRGEVSALMHELLALKDSWQGAASAQFRSLSRHGKPPKHRSKRPWIKYRPRFRTPHKSMRMPKRKVWDSLHIKSRWGGAPRGAPPQRDLTRNGV